MNPLVLEPKDNTNTTELEDRLARLEKDVQRLNGLFSAMKGPSPCERGMQFFAEGDVIPNKSVTDLMEGRYYLFKDDEGKEVALRFTKNESGKTLLRGESYKNGTVDSQLRHNGVLPGNFFWLEM